MKIRERLEASGCGGEGLPTFFVLPASGDSLRLSGPELHGDIGVRIAGDDSGPAGIDGRTNEVTFDFRAADKAVVQAIVTGLGPEIREESPPAQAGSPRSSRGRPSAERRPLPRPGPPACPAWRITSSLSRRSTPASRASFDCFEHIHAAMHALDFLRMVRMDGGIGGACDGDEVPPHLRHPTRQGLTGRSALVVTHARP
jgi:hypothetical protein